MRSGFGPVWAEASDVLGRNHSARFTAPAEINVAKKVTRRSAITCDRTRTSFAQPMNNRGSAFELISSLPLGLPLLDIDSRGYSRPHQLGELDLREALQKSLSGTFGLRPFDRSRETPLSEAGTGVGGGVETTGLRCDVTGRSRHAPSSFRAAAGQLALDVSPGDTQRIGRISICRGRAAVVTMPPTTSRQHPF